MRRKHKESEGKGHGGKTGRTREGGEDQKIEAGGEWREAGGTWEALCLGTLDKTKTTHSSGFMPHFLFINKLLAVET